MNLYLKLLLFLMPLIDLCSAAFDFINDPGLSQENQPWSNVTFRDIWDKTGSQGTEGTVLNNPSETELEFELETILVESEAEAEIVPETVVEYEIEVETAEIVPIHEEAGDETIIFEEETNIDNQEVVVIDDWARSPVLPNLADGNGWNEPEYYSTIRVLTLNEAIWLFARGSDGMQVYNYNHSSGSWIYLPILPDLNDTSKWGDSARYYSTIRVIIFYNDFWLLARNADGLQLYRFDPLPDMWTKKLSLDTFSDLEGWGSPEYYSTIEAFSYSGKIWLFARGKDGEIIYQYSPQEEDWSPPSAGFFSLNDGHGWNNGPEFYSTIQIVRIEANFWVLARGVDGMNVFQYDSSVSKWTPKATLPDLADSNGWDQPEAYSTIQTVFLESQTDYIWLFARNQFGMQTFQYDTDKDRWTNKEPLPDLSDNNKWGSVQYYSTIQTVALNTSIALVARGPDGLQYFEYTPGIGRWNHVSTLDVFSDANGWNSEKYYSTIRAINYKDKLNVLARGPDGMQVYYMTD